MMAMLDRSRQYPAAVRSQLEPPPHSDALAAGGGGVGGGGGGGGVLHWLAARGGMLEGDGNHSVGSLMGYWREGLPPGDGSGGAGLLALEHSWFASYVDSAPWEVRPALSCM